MFPDLACVLLDQSSWLSSSSALPPSLPLSPVGNPWNQQRERPPIERCQCPGVPQCLLILQVLRRFFLALFLTFLQLRFVVNARAVPGRPLVVLRPLGPLLVQWHPKQGGPLQAPRPLGPPL